MKRCIVSVCVAAILLSVFSSSACINPADRWAAGVVLNNGEQVDFSRLDSLGQTGSGITKTGSGTTAVYKYRSHYAPEKAMVYLDRYTPVTGSSGSFARIAVIADSAAAGTTFYFSAALRVELDWLCCPALGVLTMPLPERRAVVLAIKQGNSQYWTRQNRVLSYSEWFTGDTLNGTWGTTGINGGCGLDAVFDPPSQPLSLAALQDTFRIGASAADFPVINIRTNETRHVVAVRETTGQYYQPFLSRAPEFRNKYLTGYFDYDSLSAGRWDSVFITLALVGTVSAIERSVAGFPSRLQVSSSSAKGTEIYNLRGCRVARPSGVVLINRNGRLTKRVAFFIR